MAIAIIGLLSVILVPNVMNLIDKNNIESCKELIQNIESSTKIYVSENKYELNFDCSNTPKEITLKTLVDSKSINSPIINPITKEEVDLNNKIKVTYNCTTKSFTYQVTGINCTK